MNLTKESPKSEHQSENSDGMTIETNSKNNLSILYYLGGI